MHSLLIVTPKSPTCVRNAHRNPKTGEKYKKGHVVAYPGISSQGRCKGHPHGPVKFGMSPDLGRLPFFSQCSCQAMLAAAARAPMASAEALCRRSNGFNRNNAQVAAKRSMVATV